jgi:hypothetical protein
MKCTMVEMRENGVDLPKWKLRERGRDSGELVVMDVRDEGVGRSIKVAKFTPDDFPNWLKRLFEPRLVWMNEGRFVLAGVERVQCDGRVVHYAQAWLCKVEPGEEAAEDVDYRR